MAEFGEDIMSSDVMELDAEIVKGRVHAAVEKLLKNDKFLFKVGSSERSITHKLGEYLQEQFREWDVDCEYNRHGVAPKSLQSWPRRGGQASAADGDPRKVFPDIIVHRRGTSRNLLVIEAKKSNGASSTSDEEKLGAFLRDFRYCFAYAIYFPVEELDPDDDCDGWIREVTR